MTLVQIFLPFNANVDLAIAGFSVMLFSGFVLYDTQQIMKRLSPDEHILGECCHGFYPPSRFPARNLVPFVNAAKPSPPLLSRFVLDFADAETGSLTLYLDALNLFLSVLRVVSIRTHSTSPWGHADTSPSSTTRTTDKFASNTSNF